jgi:signal transduction histidine kinase
MSSPRIDRFRHALPLRLAAWYGLLFVASAVGLVGITYVLLSNALTAQDRAVVATMLERYAEAYGSGGLPALQRMVTADRLEGLHERLFIRVVGRRAQAVYVNAPVGWDQFDLFALDAPREGPGGWLQIEGRRDGSVLDVATARLADGSLVQVGRSSQVRDELLRQFRSRVLVVLAFILTIAVAGGTILTSVGLAPVRAMAAAVRSIVTTGRLDARVPGRGTGDALDELGSLVNGMLDRIQKLIEGMRGALDNVAHDLRTPLTRLRNVAESALAAPDPAAARLGLERVLEEAERLNSMLTTLMDISEAETGAMRLSWERVRLAAVVQEAMDLYADLAEEKGIALGARVNDAIEVVADRTRLRQALANLLDNATKYTGSGGRVDVTAEVDAGEVIVAVRDTGIGIDADALPHVFERLYRADASRTERGLGLGLSLVKAIAESHRGRVTVESAPGRGSVFSIVLPAPAPDRASAG